MKLPFPRLSPIVFGLLPSVFSACDDVPPNGTPGPSTPPDPRGDEVELYGEWDVNGKVPSANVCAQAGIDEVEILFTDSTGTTTYEDSRFRFPCADGFYDSGATRLLRAGTFGYRWLAFKGSERVLESRLYTYSVSVGDELSLMPVDFVRREPPRVDVSLRFALDVGEGGCADAHVDQGVSWALHAGTASGPILASSGGTFGCSDAFVIADEPSGSLAEGAAVLEVQGSAMDGALWRATCSVDVPWGGAVALTCHVPRVP